MRARVPLVGKVLLLSFLNLFLLGSAVLVIARAQFRVNAGSFLLAPAESRIMRMAQSLALEMEESRPEAWEGLISRYSRDNGVRLMLVDESGDRIGGSGFSIPNEVASRIPRRRRPPEEPGRRGEPARRPEQDPPPEGGNARPPAPPLFLMATANPARYWAGVRIPLRSDPRENPHPGTLLIMSESLLASSLFFDIRPWLTIGAAVILASVVCWLPFIRGLTRSISQMMAAAGQIAEGHFEVHVAADRRDEIGQLGQAINRMASRLSGFLNGQKQFLSGIAHELCNPIATMQFGLAGLERRVDPEQRLAVADIQDEVDHMSALVNELLSFSRDGMRALDLKPAMIGLAEIVARVLERESRPPACVTVDVDASLTAFADPEYVFRALSNVVRNAIRYAGHAGPVQIRGTSHDGMVSIVVADSGPGIPEEHIEKIFDPFYRPDAARSPETGGLGLGLAIVRNCVEACHGIVRCRNRKPSGLEVEICLPAQKL